MNIAFFVSGHGFGHISRSFEIVRELLNLNHKIFLFTERGNFIGDFKHNNLVVYPISTDIGIVQSDSISMDLNNTKLQIQNFKNYKDSLILKLLNNLRENSVDLLFSDSSSLPFRLSNILKIPGYFVGNFTWDFIYNHYSKDDPFFYELSQELEEEYSLCTLGYILPFHCPITSIHKKKYIGLIGRKPKMKREEVRNVLQFKPDSIYFLFSFGAYGLDSKLFQFENLPKNYKIVTSGLVDFSGKGVLAIENINYSDLLAGCDFVVTKPGYGILAEAYNSNCSIIYTDRGDFIEYPYLVEAMKNYHNSHFISKNNLYSLKLENIVQNLNKTIDIPKKPLKNGLDEILKTFL